MSGLDEYLGDLIHHLATVITLLLISFLLLWITLYWTTWTYGRECVSRAMTDIQTIGRSEGIISASDVDTAMGKYCKGNAYKGFTKSCNPGFGATPEYLGQPIYVEVKATYHIFMKDIIIAGRADIGNAGMYSSGYNTIDEM